MKSIPNITGSIYTGDESSENLDNDVENRPLVEDAPNVRRKKTRKCIPEVSPEGSTFQTTEDPVPEVFDDNLLHVPGNDDKTSRKKRRSYSLEDGLGRYSLDGSRKNRYSDLLILFSFSPLHFSLLTVTGDMEINISMPPSVRRSFSGERISFSTR